MCKSALINGRPAGKNVVLLMVIFVADAIFQKSWVDTGNIFPYMLWLLGRQVKLKNTPANEQKGGKAAGCRYAQVSSSGMFPCRF